jgi:hypothetical protein
VSPEAEKIKAIQAKTGPQYFTKTQSFDTPDSKPGNPSPSNSNSCRVDSRLNVTEGPGGQEEAEAVRWLRKGCARNAAFRRQRRTGLGPCRLKAAFRFPRPHPLLITPKLKCLSFYRLFLVPPDDNCISDNNRTHET